VQVALEFGPPTVKLICITVARYWERTAPHSSTTHGELLEHNMKIQLLGLNRMLLATTVLATTLAFQTPLFAQAAAPAPTAAAPAPGPAVSDRLNVADMVGYSTFRAATLSQDGKNIAGIIADGTGDKLIVFNRTTRVTTPIQLARRDQNLEITFVAFKGNDRIVFGLQQKFDLVAGTGGVRVARTVKKDQGFRFVSRVYSSDIDGKNLMSLYDPSGSQGFPRELSANLQSILGSDPENVLMGVPTLGGSELRKVNVRTGRFSVVDRGNSTTFNWTLDSNTVPLLRQDSIAGGRGSAWSRRAPGSNEWIEIARFIGNQAANGAPEFEGVGPGRTPGEVVVSARPNGRDTNGLYYYETATGRYVAPLYENDKFDVFQVMRLPNSDEIIGACYDAYKAECKISDPQMARSWASVEAAVGSENEVSLANGGDLSGSILIKTNGPRNLGTFLVYNTVTGALDTFQSERRAARAVQLPTQTVHHYKATDGTDLWGYLWLPPGATAADRNLPMVVVPHGGPEGRDNWGFDPFATYWSSQGYAVFQPNFRGGSGFGRKFVEAGWGQWGRLIQDDIRQGTLSLTRAGIADGNKTCIAGWSHGGYVAFTASFQDTSVYRCSFAGAGVSDLGRMLDWVRAEQGGASSVSYQYWTRAIGDPASNATLLTENSANRNIDKVGMPILVVHGEMDNIVPVEQSKLFIANMERAGKPVESLILPRMDHKFRPDQGGDWAVILVRGREFFEKHIGPGWRPPAAATPTPPPATR
jgi:dienelactone hydrolase